MVRKTKNKKTKRRMFFIFLLMANAILFALKFNLIFRDNPLLKVNSPFKAPQVSSLSVATDSPVFIPTNVLSSPNAILLSLNDRTILMQKNSDEIIYPASLTKIMTVIVALENLTNLQDEIKLSDSIFEELHKADSSIAGFQPGEKVRGIDLLYGAMLPSGGECCIGLANQIAGSEQEFVRLMNQKAEDIGLDNTHFVNSTGLHDTDHITTVKDMSVLLSYALENQKFREIFTTARYSTSPTNKHPDGITFYSTLFEKLDDSSLVNGKILGGKTGYTKEAGLCLASLAKQGGKEYVLVTASAKGDHNTEQYNITDALAVYSSMENSTMKY